MFAETRLGIQRILASAGLGVDIAYEGVTYTRVGNTFLVFQLLTGGDNFYADIGPTRTTRLLGIIQININIPAEQGTKPAEVLGDTIAALYENPFVYGNVTVNTRPGNLRSIGTRDGYYTAILDIPFQADFKRGATMAVSFLRSPFTGVLDGVNKVFTVTNLTNALDLQAFQNGLLVDPSLYSVAAPNITFVTAPDSTDFLEFFTW